MTDYMNDEQLKRYERGWNIIHTEIDAQWTMIEMGC